MKLANGLLGARLSLACGIAGLSILSDFLPLEGLIRILVASGAWLCFLLLIIVYLFDIAYHNIR